jgi:hypothetical protein
MCFETIWVLPNPEDCGVLECDSEESDDNQPDGMVS